MRSYLFKILALTIIFCSSSWADAVTIKKIEAIGKKMAPHRKKEIKKIAPIVFKLYKKYNHDPKIVLALLKVESDINQKAISKTKDYSMAQINFKVWNKEFKRLNFPAINLKKLKNDEAYALEVMGKILHILKNRYKGNPYWYSYYHSGTPKFQRAYLKRVQYQFSKINQEKKNYAKN